MKDKVNNKKARFYGAFARRLTHWNKWYMLPQATKKLQFLGVFKRRLADLNRRSGSCRCMPSRPHRRTTLVPIPFVPYDHLNEISCCECPRILYKLYLLSDCNETIVKYSLQIAYSDRKMPYWKVKRRYEKKRLITEDERKKHRNIVDAYAELIVCQSTMPGSHYRQWNFPTTSGKTTLVLRLLLYYIWIGTLSEYRCLIWN